MTYPYKSLGALSLDVLDTINLNEDAGSEGNVITSISGKSIWTQVTGLSSLYTDSTDLVQSIDSSPVAISFDNEEFNFAGIEFTSNNNFRFSQPGIYNLTFQACTSNSEAESMISFFINGVQVYGNLTIYSGVTDKPQQFTLIHTLQIDTGNELQVVGEKVNGGPNFLKNNPLYANPITQLTITRV